MPLTCDLCIKKAKNWPNWSKPRHQTAQSRLSALSLDSGDLSELIGESVPGSERLNFSDALKHWEGRFHKITLEDRNLPAIAEKRVLKRKSEAARQELDAAFEQTKKNP